MPEPREPQQTEQFGSRPEHLEQFTAMVGDLREYNDQFSMGKMLAKALLDHVEIADKAAELEGEGLPADEAVRTAEWLHDSEPMSEQQRMNREVLGVTMAETLETSGLGLSPVRKGAFLFSSHGEDSVGPVRMQITDGGKFVGMLQAVKSSGIEPSEVLRESASKVAEDAAQEAYQELSDGNDNPLIAETLAYAPAIHDALEAIGATPSEQLDTLAKYNNQGVVREYIAANNAGLFNEPGDDKGFGPSRWQRDATGEFLAKRWAAVLEAISAARNNSRGAEFAAELTERAKAHLDSARRDWQDLKHSGYATDGYGDDFESIFETVAKTLDEAA